MCSYIFKDGNVYALFSITGNGKNVLNTLVNFMVMFMDIQ